jgi:hypothetical protein
MLRTLTAAISGVMPSSSLSSVCAPALQSSATNVLFPVLLAFFYFLFVVCWEMELDDLLQT